MQHQRVHRPRSDADTAPAAIAGGSACAREENDAAHGDRAAEEQSISHSRRHHPHGRDAEERPHAIFARRLVASEMANRDSRHQASKPPPDVREPGASVDERGGAQHDRRGSQRPACERAAGIASLRANRATPTVSTPNATGPASQMLRSQTKAP